MKMDNLLFGAAYYTEYMPYERTEKDMRLMKEAGMNVIRIAESTWSTWEPCDNVYNFEKLHLMLRTAAKYDLKVIAGTPTYAIPPWLYHKYPDILAVTKDGPCLYGHRQLTDITNPHYLYHAERIIRKLMEEIRDYPHIIGFQLDNETRSAGAASPETQKLFVKKMQEKYGDIESFNHEFGLDYWSNRISSWEDFPDVRGTINGSLSAAYKAFLRDYITDFLTWQSDILKEYMRPGQFITHNFDFSWIGHSYGIQPEVNQFDAVKCMDVAGVDIYHPSQSKLTGAEIAFGGAVGRALSLAARSDSSDNTACDTVPGAISGTFINPVPGTASGADKNNNYIVLETQSQGNPEWLPYPGQLRLQAMSHLASGANGVMYWNWHSIHNAIESYWMGILSHDLTPDEDYYELKQTFADAKRIEPHIRNLKKSPEVAILADNRSLTGLDEFPMGDGLNYNDILRDYFDSCYELNIECDLVNKDSDFSAYKMLIIPALYSATDELIEKIKSYVQSGGHIIMTARSCFSDEEIKIYHDRQPHNMTDCIGAAYSRFTKPEDVFIKLSDELMSQVGDVSDESMSQAVNLSDDANAGESAACDGAYVYPATGWVELLNPDTADIWAAYYNKYWKEHAAVTYNRYGKGGAVYVACHTSKDAIKLLLRKTSGHAGIKLPGYTFPIIRKSGINECGKQISYYFNYSSEPVSFVYDGAAGTELLSERRLSPGCTLTISDWGLLVIEDASENCT